MKRHILILSSFLALTILIKAQEPAGAGIPFNYSGLEKKLQKSDEAIQDAKKGADPKTWIARGELLMEIYSVNNMYLSKGMNVTGIKLLFKEPKEIRTISPGVEEYVYDRITLTIKDGKLEDWVETDKIHENPLPAAKEAFEKALTLDDKGKYTDKVKEDLDKLKGYFESEAIYTYNHKNYDKAYKMFDNILKINELPLMEGVKDTIIFYSAGRAALEAGDSKEAVNMFNKALSLGYQDPYIFVFGNQAYKELGDTIKGLDLLKKGFMKYPENQAIQIELINYYLLRSEGEQALEYLKMAKASDSTNLSYIFAEGTIYDKMGRTEDAIGAYKECLAINPDYFNANYNLSILYYNTAVKMIDDCQLIENPDKYNACQKEAKEKIDQAIPFMEKARDVSEDSQQKCDALNILKTLYYRAQMEEKRKAVVEEFELQGCDMDQ